jgi:hypothetical protein
MLLEADEAGRALLLDRSVAIVDLPIERPRGLLARLEREHTLEPQELLVQSLFDRDQYFPAAKAPDKLARAKLFHTIQLCKLLGAREVTLEEVRSTDAASDTRWKASGSRMKVVSGSVEQTSTDTEAFVDSLSMHQRFPSAESQFEAAEAYLLEKGLYQDDQLRLLIDLRRGENPLLEQTVKIGTRSEVEELRKWLAKCKVPTANLAAEVEKVEKQLVDYRLSFNVVFAG